MADSRKKAIWRAWKGSDGSWVQETVSRRWATGLISSRYAAEVGTSWQILRCQGYGRLYLNLATQQLRQESHPNRAAPGIYNSPTTLFLQASSEE